MSARNGQDSPRWMDVVEKDRSPILGMHYSLFLQTACEEAATLKCRSYMPAKWSFADNEQQEGILKVVRDRANASYAGSYACVRRAIEFYHPCLM